MLRWGSNVVCSPGQRHRQMHINRVNQLADQCIYTGCPPADLSFSPHACCSHPTQPSSTAMPSEPKYVTLSTSMGDVTFELYVDHAPKVRSLSLLSLARVVCSLRPRRRDGRLLLAQGPLTLTSPACGCDAIDGQELHWSCQQGLLQRHRLPPDHLRSFLPSLPS